MSRKGHIVDKLNSKTVQQKYKKGERKNDKSMFTKRGLNKTHERPTGSNNPPVPKH